MRKLFVIMLMGLLLLTACTKVQNPPGTPTNPEITVTPGNEDENEATPTKSNEQYTVADFFPLKKDVHMVYKGFNNEFAEFETYVDYVRNNKIQLKNINPGTSSVVVYEVGENELRQVYKEGEIYFHHEFTSSKGDSELLIKGPIAVGTEWKLKDGSMRSITAIDKDVKTPYGSFKALEVTTVTSDYTEQEYYVKDMGLVKRISTDKDSKSTVSSELEKIEENVPFKHTVRFYYPDFLNNRLVYIDRVVEIKTNEDMKFKFQKELKTIPEGSELTKPLTPGVQVSSTQLQINKGLVAVDFSNHLINEMNAGSSLESMIIQSIVNTYGNYYNVNKVIITIDGKPYSSGHILLKPGEYFDVATENAEPYK